MRPLEELIPGVLAASKAPSTVKGYHSQFQKWKARTASFPGVLCFPASALHFSLYLISLVQSGYSFATINSAFCSVNFFHNSCGVPNPCNSGFVKTILEGCKRVSANFVSSKKRLPICPEHLHALVQRFAVVNACSSDIRDVCLCLVSFAGFLRFNEACNIRWCDIDFKDTYLSLYIPRSKLEPTNMVPGQQG